MRKEASLVEMSEERLRGIFAEAARGERIPKGQESRLKRLLEWGLIERGSRRSFILAHRDYEFVGQKGLHPQVGLGWEQNLAWLVKHIEENKATGSKLEELCRVLPALPSTHIQSLLSTLKRSGGKPIRSGGVTPDSGSPGGRRRRRRKMTYNGAKTTQSLAVELVVNSIPSGSCEESLSR